MKKIKPKATSIRLGDLKPILQKEAMKLDRSLHWLMIKILKDYTKTIQKD